MAGRALGMHQYFMNERVAHVLSQGIQHGPAITKDYAGEKSNV